MNSHPGSLMAAAALVVLTAKPATAQQESSRADSEEQVPAPTRAIELTFATGYAQPFGTAQPGVGMPRLATAGIGFDGGVGYRIDRHFAASLGGQYQELRAERDDAARSFAWNLAVQYHVAPSVRLDPWLELGSGYRMLWLVPAGADPTLLLHGPQLVRVRAGLDIRVSPSVALSPVIGADATMFVFQDDVRTSAIANPTLSTFVFAGLQGRLDARLR